MQSTAMPGPVACPIAEHQLELQRLPTELIEHIAIRIRDLDAMLNFSSTCKQFAEVSRTPTFVAALTDTFVDRNWYRIARCDGAINRAAQIYDLAEKMRSRMKPRHLQKLSGLLCSKDRAEHAQETALIMQHENLAGHQMRQVDAPLNLEKKIAAGVQRMFMNRVTVLSAALLSGPIKDLNGELKAEANKVVTSVWKNNRDAIDVLFGSPDVSMGAPASMLIGHAVLHYWFFLKEVIARDDSTLLRSHAANLLSWCVKEPVAVRIDLMEKIVEWSATCLRPQPEELTEDSEMQDDEFDGFSSLNAQEIYKTYFESLNMSAHFGRTPDPELAQRFFAMLDLAITDMVRNNVPIREDHLGFAKMLPALPWRENGKAGLRWLENALKHHEGVVIYSDKAALDSQESSDDEEAPGELPPIFACTHRAPLPVATWKALIPQGIFTDKELAYLLQSIADGTFSWEALEEIDPPTSSSQGNSSSH